MASVLVAGATGYLGRYVVAELHSRRHLVRAVVRDRARACREGPWGSPSLDGLVEEWAVGSVIDSGFTRIPNGDERVDRPQGKSVDDLLKQR